MISWTYCQWRKKVLISFKRMVLVNCKLIADSWKKVSKLPLFALQNSEYEHYSQGCIYNRRVPYCSMMTLRKTSFVSATQKRFLVITLLLQTFLYILKVISSLRSICFCVFYKQIKIPSTCLLYTSPSPRDLSTSRMPSSA